MERVCEVHAALCTSQQNFLYVLLPTQLHAPPETRRHWDFRAAGSQKADAERHIWDILLHRLHCSYCLKPTLLTIPRTVPAFPQCEPAHSHTASCGVILPQSREAAAVRKSQLSEHVLHGWDWISPLKETPARLKTQICPGNSPTWKPGFLLQGREIVPTQCIHLKHLENTIKSVFIPAHWVWNTCIIFKEVTRR